MEPLVNHNFLFPVFDFVTSVALSVNTDREHAAGYRDKNKFPLPPWKSTLNEPSWGQGSRQKVAESKVLMSRQQN